MNHTNYGGRHTSNLISDVITKSRAKPTPEANRVGKTNFLPFEEIGGSLDLPKSAPNNTKKPIPVEDKDILTRVAVNRSRAIPASDYTYVPPLRTLALNTGTYDKVASATLLDEFDSFLNEKIQKAGSAAQSGVKSLSQAARDFYELVIVTPLLATGNFIKKGFYSSNYSVTDGLQELARIKRTSVIKITAGVVVGALSAILLTQAITELRAPGAAGHGQSAADQSISVSDRKADKGSSTSHPKSTSTNKTAKNPAPMAPTTKAGVNAVGGNLGTTGLNQPTAYPMGSVGYGAGGGNALPTTSPSAPTNTIIAPTTPITDPMLVPNPADAVPYYQATVPASTVQTGGKQVIGTSPATLTTN